MGNYIDLCTCFLILSGAFTLICLGVLLLKASTTINEVTTTLKVVQVTLDKANKTLDDVNVKLEMLNTPIAVISGFFNRDRSNSGFLGGIMAAKSLFKKKK